MIDQQLIVVAEENGKPCYWYDVEAYINELNERLESFANNPDQTKDWAEVKRQ